MFKLQQRICGQYEAQRLKQFRTITDFLPPRQTVPGAEMVSVYLSAAERTLLSMGPRPVHLEEYCQAFANANAVTIVVENGKETRFFISEAEYRHQRAS